MKNDLITIIRDYLQGNASDVTVDDELLKYAEMHQVGGIVYKQTNDERLHPEYYFSFLEYTLREHLLQQIQELLDENHVDFFLVKGMEVASYYPNPFLKTMGDIDLTVHLEDKEKAADLLKTLGFNQPEDDRELKSEWHLMDGQLLIELHHALLYGRETGEVVNDDYLAYFGDCWSHVHNHYLDKSFHLLYLFIHLRKHYMNKGVGIRQFLDIACFSRDENIDWKWVEKECRKLNLTNFVHKVYGLIYRWWGVSFPMTEEISDEFYAFATDTILECGVFGQENENFQQEINNIQIAGDSYFKSKLHFLFPPYEKMIKETKYKGLKGRPYLYPYYWVLRIITNRKVFSNRIKFLFFGSKEIDARMKDFDDWGLK